MADHFINSEQISFMNFLPDNYDALKCQIVEISLQHDVVVSRCNICGQAVYVILYGGHRRDHLY